MKNILLLGPGKSRRRLQDGPDFGTVSTELITVLDHSEAVLHDWAKDASMVLKRDLRKPPLLLSSGYYNEVHAYEVLNLLPGGAGDFFHFWRDIWDCMKPGARLYATVPHWKSEWIHAYPAPQRTYTRGLLTYLNSRQPVANKEDFSDLWPSPYNFTTMGMWEMSHPDGTLTGFHFILEKSH